MFHLLSPLTATGTCYASFAVSTCSHRHMLCFICCLHLQPQTHAMFHLLFPLAATDTCYVSFAVSTCSHRQNTAGFQASAGQWPSARAVVSTWDGELEAASLLHLFNPFTVPACKTSTLKHARMCLQNSIFSAPITSILNAVYCDQVLSHCFGVRSTPVLPQWHVGDPGRSAKGAGGRLQLNTHTPYVYGFA